ncbi:MAG: 2TM domain-containing protein [Phaeodactylibacter sp.]|nr:2TM domain-containing protein [Phaeodactylibacter sp.]MCB9273596.1 2TM domain-containing protein [Lewinellaceae bacterium]
MEEDQIYRQAKKKVKAKKGFYAHLGSYIAVGIFFLAMNLLTFKDGGHEIWFMYPMLPWGVGLLIHYFAIFGLPGNRAMSDKWEEQEMQKELDRLRRKYQGRLEAPQEEPESLDLDTLNKEKEKIKEKRSDWRDEDLV